MGARGEQAGVAVVRGRRAPGVERGVREDLRGQRHPAVAADERGTGRQGAARAVPADGEDGRRAGGPVLLPRPVQGGEDVLHHGGVAYGGGQPVVDAHDAEAGGPGAFGGGSVPVPGGSAAPAAAVGPHQPAAGGVAAAGR